ncbi:hypothetical protein ACG94V_21480 [Acinetobacter sp. ULE_I001]|uniref:hypothetical protein n=1 Tax=Acinetobacter sp. ULE_I001 TaxID=3373064 RepID=UPI003AF6EE66
MPKSIKTVANNYTYNTNYNLDSRRFESILTVLESSRDNLNKPKVAHIVLQVESADFDKSSINKALIKSLSRKLKTGFGYYIAMEKSKYSGFHIHLMLTFSQGSKYSFTVLNEARDCLYALDGVSTATALPRKQERSVSIDTADYYTAFKDIKKTNNYFHDLNDSADFKDAVYRYSYFAKDETKLEQELKGIRLTQSKIPKADKTKQEQKKRTIKKSEIK